MKYKQIKTKKIYEEVTEALLEAIRKGKLKPGDKLDSVQQLAENFQVGRSAIREALSALKAMGLIEIKQGEGTYVLPFEAKNILVPLSTDALNKENVRNLLEVRKIVETGAVAAAANNRNEENLKMMKDALEKMKGANGNGELGEQSDFAFHLALAASTQNPLLSDLLLQISDLMQATMKETRRLWIYSKQTTIEKLHDEHVKIYEAILAQNEKKAREEMLQHLENVEAILQKFFDESSMS